MGIKTEGAYTMFKKLFNLTLIILAFCSKTVLGATQHIPERSDYFTVEAVCAVLILILVINVYCRVKEERAKQYNELRKK